MSQSGIGIVDRVDHAERVALHAITNPPDGALRRIKGGRVTASVIRREFPGVGIVTPAMTFAFHWLVHGPTRIRPPMIGWGIH